VQRRVFFTILVVLVLATACINGSQPRAQISSPTSATVSPSSTITLPECVHRLVLEGSEGTPRPTVILPAPSITPDSGTSGTIVTVKGTGFPTNISVVVIALYGDNNCSISGLGDEFLGRTDTTAAGDFKTHLAWPSSFSPYLGRGAGSGGPPTLPEGPYYIVALPCDPQCGHLFYEGSAPGGPFTLST
jgi:hypothetical protein